jgi:hypothetical protein
MKISFPKKSERTKAWKNTPDAKKSIGVLYER